MFLNSCWQETTCLIAAIYNNNLMVINGYAVGRPSIPKTGKVCPQDNPPIIFWLENASITCRKLQTGGTGGTGGQVGLVGQVGQVDRWEKRGFKLNGVKIIFYLILFKSIPHL